MNSLADFEQFLSTIDLETYRKRYAKIRIVEMDLSKPIQAIELLYEVYGNNRSFLSFDQFYSHYLQTKHQELEVFRTSHYMCKTCFYRGLEARIYRTGTGLLTQIQGGYVCEEQVFGTGSVEMSEQGDHLGADIRVCYHNHFLNYQVKKTTYRGVRSRKPLARKKNLQGEHIDIKYEVPNSSYFKNPKRLSGEGRTPYLRFIHDTRTKRLPNGFIVFTADAFLPDKERIDMIR